MERTILCNHCGVLVAKIRDGSLKKGIVVYCASCDATIKMLLNKSKPADMPDFFKDIFGGGG